MNNKSTKILGVDWGEKKVGLAFAEGTIADPVAVIRYKDKKQLVKELKSLIGRHSPEKIVVGVSEGISAEKAREFAGELKRQVGVEIVLTDETLSTHEAKRLSQEAGIGREKRHELEDAFAAAVMLQSYLDKHV